MIELLIVISVLAVLTTIVAVTRYDAVRVPGTDHDAATIATMATMQTLRDTLVGASSSEPGYLQDVGRLPSRLGALLVNLDNEPLYDPATKRGWRGPYLADDGARYGDRIESDDDFPTAPPAILDDPAILDAWGKPVVLQLPGTDYARLVSAGPDRILKTDPSDLGAAERDDDLVLFLFISDPNPTNP